MTPKEQAAMQQALKVMRGINHGTDWNNGTHAAIYRPMFPGAITELEEALAQPQGEWVDLTDDDISDTYAIWWRQKHVFGSFTHAAIAKFKEKNTPPVVPQGEPVALLQLAEDALVYHTEQTRPIQNTIDALAAIQKFKEKQR